MGQLLTGLSENTTCRKERALETARKIGNNLKKINMQKNSVSIFAMNSIQFHQFIQNIVYIIAIIVLVRFCFGG